MIGITSNVLPLVRGVEITEVLFFATKVNALNVLNLLFLLCLPPILG